MLSRSNGRTPSAARVRGVEGVRLGPSLRQQVFRGPAIEKRGQQNPGRKNGAVGPSVSQEESWPDRSALASAMGELALHLIDSPFARIRRLGGSAMMHLGSFRNPTATIRGLGESGTVRCRRGRLGHHRRDETLETDRNGHGTPPRATREKPGMKSGGPTDRTAKGLHPATDRFLSAGRPTTPSRGRRCRSRNHPSPPREPGRERKGRSLE